jgi:hypothetical protein
MGTVSSPAHAPALTVSPLALLALFWALALPAQARALEPQAMPAPSAATLPAAALAAATPSAAGVTVVLFACHDCPICTSSMPEVQRIADEYGGRGVRLTVVLEDADLTPQAVRDWAAAYCPRLQPVLDADQARARTLQAQLTPEVVVLGSDGAVRYRGRIDDGWVALGRPRPAPTSHDLREALDALLAGRAVRQPATKAVGCVIDYNDGNKP